MKKLFCKKEKQHWKQIDRTVHIGQDVLNLKKLAQEATKFQSEIGCSLDSINVFHVINSHHVQYSTWIYSSQKIEKHPDYEENENAWEWLHY